MCMHACIHTHIRTYIRSIILSEILYIGIRSLQNLVAISIEYCQTLLTLKQDEVVYRMYCSYSVQGLVAKVKDTVAIG